MTETGLQSKIILSIIVFTMTISCISAMDWDNAKSYDTINKEVTITNALGLGSDIAKAKLITPQVFYVIEGKDRKVAEFEVDLLWDDYSSFLNEIELINNKNGKATSRTITYKYKVVEAYYVDIGDYKTTCVEKTSVTNGTKYNECNKEIIGTHKETRYTETWLPLEKLDLTKGKITIGLFADVYAGDNVEWIPTMFGVRVQEWATWTASLNVGLITYYNMEETAGTYISGQKNNLSGQIGTNSGGESSFQIGIIGNALNLTYGGQSYVNITNPNGTYQPAMLKGLVNVTFCAWLYPVYNNPAYYTGIFDNGEVGAGWRLGISTGASPKFMIEGKNFDPSQDVDIAPVNKNAWNFLCMAINASDVLIYHNATLNHSLTNAGLTDNDANTYLGAWDLGVGGDARTFFSGKIDEVGLWNRTLSATEITNLYNGGAGITYNLNPLLNSTQNKPANNYTTLGSIINLSCNFTSEYQDISSIKVLVYDASNNLDYTNTNDTLPTGTKSINYSWITPSLDVGVYSWACYGYGSEGINYSTGNRTINIKSFIENSQTFTPSTLMGSLNNFKINLTYNNSIYTYIVGTLWYNNTGYSGTQIGTGETIQFSVDVSAPAITSKINKTFYWNITTSAGTFASLSYQQEVTNITIDNCSSNSVLIYNFTTLDEETRDVYPVFNGTMNLQFTLSTIGTQDNFLTFAHSYIVGENKYVCFNNNFTNQYRVDLIADYAGTDHVKKFYYIDNGTLTNQTQEIDLHDLLTADSTTFLFEFTDEDGLKVEDAIIHVFRNYVGEGLYREVERSKQDNNGQTHVHLVEEDVIYYFVVSQYGRTIYTSDNYNAKCLATPCEITLSASQDEVNWSIIDNEGGKYQISSNQGARTTTTSFVLNEISLVNISLYKIINGTEVFINKTSTISASGSLTLSVPLSYGNKSFFVAVYRNNTFIKSAYIDLREDGQVYFGTAGAILGGMVVLVIMLMAVSEGAGFIIFTLFALLLVGVLKLVDFGWASLIALVCAGAVIIWKLISRRGTGQ